MRKYYTEQTMESIARRVLDAYDERLYRGQPRAIPIEDLIERHGLTLEFQYLRKNGRILGKTVFDTGLEAVYDMELGEYTLFPVKAGTILIDASLCEEETSTGRLRFTEAHELSHWILHKGLYTGTGESAALQPAVRETSMEIQANMLGSALLMPMPMVKRCFYQSGPVGIIRPLFRPCRRCFRYPARPCGSGSPTTICCKIFYCGVLKIENTLEGGTPCNK